MFHYVTSDFKRKLIRKTSSEDLKQSAFDIQFARNVVAGAEHKYSHNVAI